MSPTNMISGILKEDSSSGSVGMKVGMRVGSAVVSSGSVGIPSIAGQLASTTQTPSVRQGSFTATSSHV